jgi:hypothetical protein
MNDMGPLLNAPVHLPLRGRGVFLPTETCSFTYSFPLRGKVGMGVVQIRFLSVFSVLSVAINS